ncbi:MAG: pirin family protein [Myxococcales bacterium]|nr:pirin family protein [Myxococcales bacterium]MCB9706605.1 pirin family protein [Myxococcales bacterium]
MAASLSRRRLLVGAVSAPALAIGGAACVGASQPVGDASGAREAGAAVHTASKTLRPREVTRVIAGTASRDGAGVKLRRLLGGRELAHLDPFLLLDEIRSNDEADFIRGFPSHPHRGFETVTIVVDGHVTHRDSLGNAGDIAGGDVQWMTAGRGIIHSEMPRPSTRGGIWGYQLWVNLPARLKMTTPRYQDIGASAFPEVALGDGRARLLAGAVERARGPIDGIVTEPLALDLRLEAGARLRHPLPPGHAAFLHVLEGAIEVGERKARVDAGALAVLDAGESLELRAIDGARLLAIAAAPIGEPIARRGPFVMNTDAELQQAFADYRSGRLVAG